VSEIPSVISHITLGTNDYERAAAFYDATLAPLQFTRVPKPTGKPPLYAIDGKMPHLYLYKPFDGQPATYGNGTHVAFQATSRTQVDAFHKAALANGGVDETATNCKQFATPKNKLYVAKISPP